MSRLICFVVGTRPNFMKVAPVLGALERLAPAWKPLLVHTGQHYDEQMSDVFLRELGLPEPDVDLSIGSGTHAEQTARALTGIERVLIEHEPAAVVVAGDVNSTLAGALAAAKTGFPVVHIESGLRSFDPAMPEEHNRKLTDHLSDLLLVHSASGLENLAREGIDSQRVRLVGNTMIDSVLTHVDAAKAREPWRRFGLQPSAYGLATVHRPTLVDDDVLLRATVDALVLLARSVPIVFPVHPRTRSRLVGLGYGLDISGLVVTEPLGYHDFLGLEAAARFVLTDSGGVQEETSALGVPCFTLRDRTERPITVDLGTNTLLGLQPERISEIPSLLARGVSHTSIPLWDGQAGERSADAIAQWLGVAPTRVPAT